MRKQYLSGLAVLMASGSALAQEPEENNQVELVLDGSGSMWGQIDGEAKILIARRVISDLIEDWPSAVDLAVTAYGHRVEGDCTDIETIVPLGPIDKTRTSKAVNNITPLGKTPLTAAVRGAAERLEETGRGGSVILVTDGLETCSGDPCALGRELAERGVALKTHVIGFDLAGEDTTALKCLAEETGGTYFDAEDADGLQEALETAKEDAALEQSAVPKNVTLRAVDAQGELLSDVPNVHWEIKTAGDESSLETVGMGAVYEFGVAPGDYVVTARHGEDLEMSFSITVSADEPFEETIVFSDGTVRLNAALIENGEPVSGIFTWIVTRRNADGDVQRIAREAGRAPAFTLLAGDYDLTVSGEDLDVTTSITIVGEETRSQTIILNAGWIDATGPALSNWTVYRLNSDGGREQAAREVRASTRFLLSAGRYEVITRANGVDHSNIVEVIAGETAQLLVE